MSRVLFVGPYWFPPQFDSIEVADYVYRDLYEALAPHVDEIWVLTGHPVPAAVAAAFGSMKRLHLAGPRYAGGGILAKARRNVDFYRFGLNLVAGKGINVVTNIGSEFSVGSTVAAVGRAAHIRTVIRASGDEVASASNDGRYRGLGRLRRPVDERRRRHALGRADAVIAMSDPEATRLAGLGVDPNRIFVCPRGVDTERFRPPETRAPGPVKVLFFGRFHRSKGFDVAVQAARLLRSAEGVEVIFAGGDDPTGSIPARVIGPVSPSAMPALLGDVDITIFPSRHEGLPQGMLEAMACGCASVMNDAVYSRLAPPETGLFCALTPETFRDAVLRLARDSELRRRVGAAARAFVEGKYERGRLREHYARAVLGGSDGLQTGREQHGGGAQHVHADPGGSG